MKYRLLIFFIACGLLLFNAFAKAQPGSKRTRLHEAYGEAMKNNDLNAALVVINQLIELDSTQAPYYFTRASLRNYMNDSDFTAILADYNKVIEYYPDSSNYYYERGEFLWGRGNHNWQLALADFRKVLSLDSFNYKAYEKLHAYYAYRDTKEAATIRKMARASMQKLVDRDTTIAANWFLLARAYDLLDDEYESKTMNDKCFAHYSKAIALDTTQYEYYWQRGTKNYFYKKNYRACIDDMRKAIGLRPSHLYYLYIALCYDEMHEKEKALAAFDEGLKAFPNNWQLLERRKDIEKKKKR